MRKLLFVGSSHIGCLKIAEQTFSISRDFSCQSSFIGLPADAISSLKLVEGNLLFPPRVQAFVHVDEQACVGGRSAIHLDFFDAVVFVAGLCRLDSRLYYDPSINHIPLLSPAVIRSVVLEDSLKSETSGVETPDVYRSLIRCDSIQISFLGAPLESVQASVYEEFAEQSRANLKANAITIRSVCEKINRDNGFDFFLLPPPDLLDPCEVYTRAEYFSDIVDARGMVKQGGRQFKDMIHANALYGKEILSRIIYPSLVQNG
jgi:hypothetical protein